MITDGHLDELREIFVEHGVVLAYLFGSQAEGTARPSSDVDIAVLLPRELTSLERFRAQLSLMGACGDAIQGNDVDVVILNEATALLAHQVVKYGKVLYEDPVTRPAIDFTVCAVRYYADTEHLRRLAWKYTVEDIEQYRKRHLATVQGETTI